MDNDIRFQIEGLKQFVVESLLLKYSQVNYFPFRKVARSRLET
jgi:hypothetical protein